MRLPLVFASLSCLALLTIAAPGCATEDPDPVYLKMSYQMRCLDCTQGVPDEPVRNIMKIDGESGFHLECFASKSGNEKVLTLDASHEDDTPTGDFSFKITHARFDGKDPGNDCEVRVVEGANTYVGKCTGGEPTESKPCQLKLSKDKDDVISGTVMCDNIPNPSSSPATTRYLVEPYESDKPATLEVHSCSGL